MYLLYSEIKQDGKKFKNFNRLVEEIDKLGFPIGGMTEYNKLEDKRLLVNVIKHAEGGSEKKLRRKQHLQYFDNHFKKSGADNLTIYKTSLGEISLNITEKDFDETCSQIIAFWNGLLSL